MNVSMNKPMRYGTRERCGLVFKISVQYIAQANGGPYIELPSPFSQTLLPDTSSYRDSGL